MAARRRVRELVLHMPIAHTALPHVVACVLSVALRAEYLLALLVAVMMHRVVHGRLVLAVLAGADRILLIKRQGAVCVPTQRLDVLLVPQLILAVHHSFTRCGARGVLGRSLASIAADARPINLADHSDAATCFRDVLVCVSSFLLHVVRSVFKLVERAVFVNVRVITEA